METKNIVTGIVSFIALLGAMNTYAVKDNGALLGTSCAYACATVSAKVYTYFTPVWCGKDPLKAICSTCPTGTIAVTTDGVANTGTCIPACTGSTIYDNTKGACVGCPYGSVSMGSKCVNVRLQPTSMLQGTTFIKSGNTYAPVTNNLAQMNSTLATYPASHGHKVQLVVTHVITNVSGLVPANCPANGAMVQAPIYYSPNPGISNNGDVNNASLNGGTTMYRCLETYNSIVGPNNLFYTNYLAHKTAWLNCADNKNYTKSFTDSDAKEMCMVSPDCQIHANARTDAAPIMVSSLCPGVYVIAASMKIYGCDADLLYSGKCSDVYARHCGHDRCGSTVNLKDSAGNLLFGTSAPIGAGANVGCLIQYLAANDWVNWTGTNYHGCNTNNLGTQQQTYDTRNITFSSATTIAPATDMYGDHTAITWASVTLDLSKNFTAGP